MEWHEGNATAMPFSDAEFDVAFCQLGLQFFPDQPAALREMHRVLVPGGRVALLVWRAIKHSPGFAAFAEALERYVSPDAAAIMHAPFVFGDTTEALHALLEQAEFRDINIRFDVRMVRFPSPEALVQSYAAGSPLASHVARVDHTARENLIRDVTDVMQPYMDDHGLAFPIEGHLATARA
jgi:ubiquinone/menaquinone biosynthesis C-methylase UbiE